MNKTVLIVFSFMGTLLYSIDPEIIVIADTFISKGSVHTMHVVKEDKDTLVCYIFNDAVVGEGNSLYKYEVQEDKKDKTLYKLVQKSDFLRSNVSICAAPFKVIAKSEEQNTLDRFRGVYKGSLKQCIPYVRSSPGNKVMGASGTDPKNDYHFFTHNTDATYIYGMNIDISSNQEDLLDDDYEPLNDLGKQKYAVVISGSSFPSVYIWKQLQGILTDWQKKGTDEIANVTDEIKKFPGHYLIAAGENNILYAKHPTRSSFLGRLERFFKKETQNEVKCKLYVQEIVDQNGVLCDLGKKINSIAELSVPLDGKVPAAINNEYAVWIHDNNVEVYSLENTNMESLDIPYRSSNEKMITQPFLVSHEGSSFAVWFTRSANMSCNAYYIELGGNKKLEIKKGNTFEKDARAFTYSASMNAFYYIAEKRGQEEAEACICKAPIEKVLTASAKRSKPNVINDDEIRDEDSESEELFS